MEQRHARPTRCRQSAQRDNPPGKKPKAKSSRQVTHDTVLRMRQACEILYPIANGLGMLRAPAASLEPAHLKTLDVIRHFCAHMDMHLEPGAPQGSIIDHLSLLVALIGGMEGGAIPPPSPKWFPWPGPSQTASSAASSCLTPGKNHNSC
ncbi:MAG: hypothetical protein ACKOS8_00105 [Gemmataceae bacterium]